MALFFRFFIFVSVHSQPETAGVFALIQYSETPLQLALSSARFRCYEMLVAAGANLFPEVPQIVRSSFVSCVLSSVFALAIKKTRRFRLDFGYH